MKVYILSSDNNIIIGVYAEKNTAKANMIDYIKKYYNQDESTIYPDEYETFILYNFKYNDEWLTYKIREEIVK